MSKFASCIYSPAFSAEKMAEPKEVAVSAADKNMCRLMESCEFVETGLRSDLKAVEVEPKYPVFTAAFIACNNFRAKMSKLLRSG